MTTKPLDALALTVLDDAAKIGRIAAIWCREMDDAIPSSRNYLARWVKRDYGPVLDKEQIDFLSAWLLDEIKQQIRLRTRRRHEKSIQDPLLDRDLPRRVMRLLNSALGPARSWVRRTRVPMSDDGECHYRAGKVLHSGLVAALIPVSMKVAQIRNPNLLVYRETGHEPKSFWVPGSVYSVEDAFAWVLPQAVKDLLEAFDGPDLTVELDYERQAVRVTTPYGTKLIPWRGLQPEGE